MLHHSHTTSSLMPQSAAQAAASLKQRPLGNSLSSTFCSPTDLLVCRYCEYIAAVNLSHTQLPRHATRITDQHLPEKATAQSPVYFCALRCGEHVTFQSELCLIDVVHCMFPNISLDSSRSLAVLSGDLSEFESGLFA